MAPKLGTSGADCPAPSVVERGTGAVAVEVVVGAEAAVLLVVFEVLGPEWLAALLSRGRTLLTRCCGRLCPRGTHMRQAKHCAQGILIEQSVLESLPLNNNICTH